MRGCPHTHHRVPAGSQRRSRCSRALHDPDNCFPHQKLPESVSKAGRRSVPPVIGDSNRRQRPNHGVSDPGGEARLRPTRRSEGRSRHGLVEMSLRRWSRESAARAAPTNTFDASYTDTAAARTVDDAWSWTRTCHSRRLLTITVTLDLALLCCGITPARIAPCSSSSSLVAGAPSVRSARLRALTMTPRGARVQQLRDARQATAGWMSLTDVLVRRYSVASLRCRNDTSSALPNAERVDGSTAQVLDRTHSSSTDDHRPLRRSLRWTTQDCLALSGARSHDRAFAGGSG